MMSNIKKLFSMIAKIWIFSLRRNFQKLKSKGWEKRNVKPQQCKESVRKGCRGILDRTAKERKIEHAIKNSVRKMSCYHHRCVDLEQRGKKGKHGNASLCKFDFNNDKSSLLKDSGRERIEDGTRHTNRLEYLNQNELQQRIVVKSV